jgi:hypothetical protein
MKYVIYVLIFVLYVWIVPTKALVVIGIFAMNAMMFYHDYRLDSLEKKYDGLVEGCSRMRDQVDALVEDSLDEYELSDSK